MANKKMAWVLLCSDEHYRSMSREDRESFISAKAVEANEFEDNMDDPVYMRLYSEEKKAKKAKLDYLFNKRHGIKNSAE